jgi:2-polyprenyl-3-methyl-5-hydroxy-6-metoxy-1,4-benzoquinol methylase
MRAGRRVKMSDHAAEVAAGKRFEFGANWAVFLGILDDRRILEAERSLRETLELADLTGRSFLDVGSGSGLFSLAARRLGARVVSFDFDPTSVACTAELRRRYRPDDPEWMIIEGSILDANLVSSLGRFDIVYSWGVLHHTGAMWDAMSNAASLVAANGALLIAIYNYQDYWSAIYLRLKRAYVGTPPSLRWLISVPYIVAQVAKGFLKDVILLRNPLARYRAKIRSRGMSTLRDWVDWIGGYPFEVAKPEEVFAFLRTRGYTLEWLRTCGSGHGCNEYLFRASADSSPIVRCTAGDDEADPSALLLR